MHLTLLVAALLAQDPPQPQAKSQPPTFASVIALRFAEWDSDHDGLLSPTEIDLLCVDPTILDADAAAAATLKRIVRSGNFEVPPLRQANLTAPPAKPMTKGQTNRDIGATAPPPEPTAPTAPILRKPNFQSNFESCLRRISVAKHELFVDATPDLDTCHQGPLGDCYLVAAVGAFVMRNPADIKQVITQLSSGCLRVAFADGSETTILPLTDAEIALSGTTGDEGLWLPILEKALGSMRQAANPQRYAAESATDAIANGGSSAKMIRMLTGHETQRIVLRKSAQTQPNGAAAKGTESPKQVLADESAKLVLAVRTEVGAALTKRLLVTCGTGATTQPPGINGKHAYAVLSYDRPNDALTLWNPHGNRFTPQGVPGLANGYPTKAGVFSVPITQFVQIFRGVIIETSTPIPALPALQISPAPAVPTKPEAPASGGTAGK
ncbi:MAG: C2 family cysteine protease [Planctomycetota bacterium]|nr:C2 family cysteine protease [Planctomycetota bacterium]